MLAMLFALVFQSGPLPDIKLEADGTRGYVFTVGTFPVADADLINDRLDVLAQQKCGKLRIRWGKYSMTRLPAGARGVTVDSFADYHQAFWCIDPASDPHQPAPAGWKASATDDADARAATVRYLAAIDRGDSVAVHAMYSPSLAEVTSTEEVRTTVTKIGAITTSSPREIVGVRWWLNPDFGPYPGIFVAVGYRGPQHCGYVLWYRVSPGNYVLSRQEIFGKPMQNKMTADELESLDRICGQL